MLFLTIQHWGRQEGVRSFFPVKIKPISLFPVKINHKSQFPVKIKIWFTVFARNVLMKIPMKIGIKITVPSENKTKIPFPRENKTLNPCSQWMVKCLFPVKIKSKSLFPEKIKSKSLFPVISLAPLMGYWSLSFYFYILNCSIPTWSRAHPVGRPYAFL